MKVVESSAVFQPKQRAERRKKQAGKTIENRTKPELVPNQASKSNIVRGALVFKCNKAVARRAYPIQEGILGRGYYAQNSDESYRRERELYNITATHAEPIP